MGYATFTSSNSWPIPAGLTNCRIRAQGGGGGGGGGGSSQVTTPVAQTGGGGAAAGSLMDLEVLLNPSDTALTITIGAGGAGGAGGAAGSGATGHAGGNGAAGGNTTVVGNVSKQTYLTAVGGWEGYGSGASTTTEAPGGTYGFASSLGIGYFNAGDGGSLRENGVYMTGPPLVNGSVGGVPGSPASAASPYAGGYGGQGATSAQSTGINGVGGAPSGTTGGAGGTATYSGSGGGGGGGGGAGGAGGAGGDGAPGQVELWWDTTSTGGLVGAGSYSLAGRATYGLTNPTSNRPAASQPVVVCVAGTSTTATCYQISGAAAIPLAGSPTVSQPILTDENGNLTFAAAPGLYDLYYNGTLVATVPVDPDPRDMGSLITPVNVPLMANLALTPGYQTIVSTFPSGQIPAVDYLVVMSLSVVCGATAGEVTISAVSFNSDGPASEANTLEWGGAQKSVAAGALDCITASVIVHLWKHPPYDYGVGLIAEVTEPMTARSYSTQDSGVYTTYMTYTS